MSSKLCPEQQRALDGLTAGLSVGNLVLLWGASGMGKTTVLKALHAQTGGAFLSARDYVEAVEDRHPFGIEEAFYRVVLQALEANEVVILDDMDPVMQALGGCAHMYPRS